MKKIFITLSVVALVIAACKKNETSTEPTVPLTKANIAGTYKVTAATFTPSGSSVDFNIFDDTSVYKTCKKDDLLIFDTTNYRYSDVGTICNPNGSTTSSPYTLKLPDTLTYGGTSYKIESLTASQIKISSSVTSPIAGKGGLTLTRQ